MVKKYTLKHKSVTLHKMLPQSKPDLPLIKAVFQ